MYLNNLYDCNDHGFKFLKSAEILEINKAYLYDFQIPENLKHLTFKNCVLNSGWPYIHKK